MEQILNNTRHTSHDAQALTIVLSQPLLFR